MAYQGKIFCLGFHKTGTSSLAAALEKLGYATIHGDPRGSWPGANEGRTFIEMFKQNNFNLPTFQLFDAFSDNPYFSIWREIYALYPDSKYILTVREDNAWLNSCVNYYGKRRVRPLRKWIFGQHSDPAKDEESRSAWMSRYRDHNAQILDFFSDKPDQFIKMDIAQGDGWNVLCPFLGIDPPDEPFPHKNLTRKPDKWAGFLKSIKRKLRL
jgi:hypothetical protein